MPPHCDSMDGPVVGAARAALDEDDVDLILPYVPSDGEDEVRAAFDAVMRARRQGDAARTVADRWFFETVVRVHRAGEGAPFTGLKPAGLGHGPVVPVAERAFDTGSADELTKLLCDTVEEEVESRFGEAMRLWAASDDVEGRRRYVEAMLGLEVWSHKLYEAAHAHPHEHGHAAPEHAH